MYVVEVVANVIQMKSLLKKRRGEGGLINIYHYKETQKTRSFVT